MASVLLRPAFKSSHDLFQEVSVRLVSLEKYLVVGLTGSVTVFEGIGPKRACRNNF